MYLLLSTSQRKGSRTMHPTAQLPHHAMDYYVQMHATGCHGPDCQGEDVYSTCRIATGSEV